MESGDSGRSKMHAENKRHTNAHQPLTSLSTTEASIPPPQLKSSINMRGFEPCYYFFMITTIKINGV
jgi:hypothetical protein